jgi:hypothetical protein
MGTADAFNNRIHELEMMIRKIEGTEKEVYAGAWDSLKNMGQG